MRSHKLLQVRPRLYVLRCCLALWTTTYGNGWNYPQLYLLGLKTGATTPKTRGPLSTPETQRNQKKKDSVKLVFASMSTSSQPTNHGGVGSRGSTDNARSGLDQSALTSDGF